MDQVYPLQAKADSNLEMASKVLVMVRHTWGLRDHSMCPHCFHMADRMDHMVVDMKDHKVVDTMDGRVVHMVEDSWVDSLGHKDTWE